MIIIIYALVVCVLRWVVGGVAGNFRAGQTRRSGRGLGQRTGQVYNNNNNT